MYETCGQLEKKYCYTNWNGKNRNSAEKMKDQKELRILISFIKRQIVYLTFTAYFSFHIF